MSDAAAGVFISYRRQEANWLAAWLHDRLVAHFGEARVFLDIDWIKPGVDFMQVIAEAIARSRVLLVIIGPQWLATGGDGCRRLDRPDDPVRVELETALRSGLRVIPLLLDGATMPRAGDLPDALAGLARLNALRVGYQAPAATSPAWSRLSPTSWASPRLPGCRRPMLRWGLVPDLAGQGAPIGRGWRMSGDIGAAGPAAQQAVQDLHGVPGPVGGARRHPSVPSGAGLAAGQNLSAAGPATAGSTSASGAGCRRAHRCCRRLTERAGWMATGCWSSANPAPERPPCCSSWPVS